MATSAELTSGHLSGEQRFVYTAASSGQRHRKKVAGAVTPGVSRMEISRESPTIAAKQGGQSVGATSGAGTSLNDLQQSRHYHGNMASNNYNGNAKVKLLITPATDSFAKRTSKQQQQMTRSATIDWQHHQHQQQQQRSQQPTTAIITTTVARQQNMPTSRKSYHHYDYYTDSDLASSSVLEPIQAANHYDENILLFSTEHSRQQANGSSGGNNNNLYSKSVATSPPLSIRQPTFSSHFRTGRFVDSYPSWRQTQSPVVHHHQNYSFHVPIQQQLHSPAASGSCKQLHQSRYGFVAPLDRVGRSGVDQQAQRPFRSKTFSHIPDMVSLSVADSGVTQVESGNYEDYYEARTGKSADLFGASKHYVQSEGDLLKAHVVQLNSKILDQGSDNPFKPGTELSWEADMMVRLMKRGYPIQELPVLVQTAKQVADKKADGQQQQPSNIKPLLSSAQSKHKQSEQLVRRQSIEDLNSVKKVWANSLSRTRSMPRFSKLDQPDSDSIDRLISSIEREMGDLLIDDNQQKDYSEQSMQKQQHTKTRRNEKTAANKSRRRGPDMEQAQLIKRPIKLSDGSGDTQMRPNNSNSRADLTRNKKRDTECCRIH